ncbi:MAG: MATE family efflux transporter, partial [Proteobacteria bacterium]|nr:MATE family efflux transporter [Pseudomonadota bacterium]
MQYFKKRWKSEGGYREFLVIAVPLILSTGAWSVQHFVDRMFLSWYSAEAIAAALPAGILNFCMMSLFIGTASYVSTFVAQYHGAERHHRIGPVLWQAIYVSAFGGIVLICMIPFAQPIFSLVDLDPLTQRYEIEYFRILCLGAGPAIAATALSGFFSGKGQTWPIMWVNALATAVNLIMDYALIFGKWGLPEMGIRGAAIATVFSGIFSFLAYLALISTADHNRTYWTLKGWKPEKELLLRLLRFGFPSGVQFFLDMAGITLFILLVGRLGTVSLAATNIALNISTLAFMPMIGSGIAISVLVGQYLGKNKPDVAQKSVYSGFHMAFMYMTTIAAAYVLIPDVFVIPFAAKADPERFAEIYRITVILLRFVALYSIFDTMNLIFSSAIKGAGDTRYVMFMLVIATSLVLVVPTYLCVVVLGYGLMASWLNFSAYVIVLSFMFFFRFLGGKWKSMRVIERRAQ